MHYPTSITTRICICNILPSLEKRNSYLSVAPSDWSGVALSTAATLTSSPANTTVITPITSHRP